MGSKILIVEDEPVIRRVLHNTLSGAGYDVILAADVTSALSEAQKHRPGLIILDLGLPAGGGFVFLQRLRVFPHLAVTSVVVISGHDRVTMEPRALEAGAAAYIEKPAKPADIIATVRQVLGES